MKRRFTQILCFIMAFQVLFASMGFSVIEHLCKIRGKQTFVVSTPKKCCSEKKESKKPSKEPHFKKTKCCEEHTAFYKISPDSPSGNSVELQNPVSFWADQHNYNFSITSWETESVSFKIPHFYNTAPPLAGKKLLIHFQTFLI